MIPEKKKYTQSEFDEVARDQFEHGVKKGRAGRIDELWEECKREHAWERESMQQELDLMRREKQEWENTKAKYVLEQLKELRLYCQVEWKG